MGFDFAEVVERLQGIAVDTLVLIPMVIVALILLFLSLVLAGYLQRLVQRVVRASERPENLAIVLGRLTRWSVVGIGLLIGFMVVFPGFSAGEFIQLVSLSGLAAGIAFRGIFEDFLAGILLLLNQPFKVGDQIVLNDHEGTIEEIQTRVTHMRTYDGRRVVIPNSDLFTNIVTVNTAYLYRRIEYDVGVGYGDDIESTRCVLLETLRKVEGVLPSPEPEALIIELADYAIVFRLRWWITPPRRIDALDTRDRILTQVRQALLDRGIDLPFPTQQVLFHDQTEATDGDRKHQREGWPAGPGTVPAPHRIADALHAVPLLPEERGERDNLEIGRTSV